VTIEVFSSSAAGTRAEVEPHWERKPQLPVIIYEGPENSGKTTVKRIVNELIEHESLSFERWTGTHYAYSMLFDRSFDPEELMMIDGKMDRTFRVLLVLLVASPKKLLERQNMDPMLDPRYHLTEKQLVDLLHFFYMWFTDTPFRNKLKINTGSWAPEKAAMMIKERLKVLGNG